MRTTPRFKHDCIDEGCCRFVGRTLRCDVYTHRSVMGEQGMIMRSGDDGPDYRSWPGLTYARMAADHDPEVFHALQLVETLLARG